MHHLNGCQITPAYKDGVLYATLGDTLYAFDALMKGGDDGIKDKPENGDRHDILWTSKLAAKRASTAPAFFGDAVILNTSAGLEFYPTKVRDFAKVERLKLIETGGSDNGGVAHNGEILVAASKTGHAAVDLKTGKELWRAESGDGSTPVIDGADVYFGDARGNLWCADLKTGEARWKADGFASSTAGPAVSKGVVYMAMDAPGAMHAVDAKTGGKLWSWDVPDRTKGVTSEKYENAVFSTPLVADGRVYFTSYSGYVYCLNAAKDAKVRLVWKEKISTPVTMTSAMVHEGAVFVRGQGATYKFAGK